MGWFDDQIEYRKKHERELLSDSFENISRSITGRKATSGFRDDADVSDAVSALLKHLGVKEKEVPPKIKGLEDRLDFLLSATGVLYREVILTKGWHRDAMGAMIATLKDQGAVVAVLPSELGGADIQDGVAAGAFAKLQDAGYGDPVPRDGAASELRAEHGRVRYPFE